MKTIKIVRKISITLVFACLLTISRSYAIGYFPDETFSKSPAIPKAGKIKFREDWVYKYNNGKTIGSGVKIGYERFDSYGLKLEEANYDRSGKSELEVTYTYDEWGREMQSLGLKENKSFFSKWTYTFDDITRTLVKSIYNCSANKEKWIYRFDEKGNIVEEYNYDSDGALNYHYEIKYTAFNKPEELIEYGANGELYEKWVYFYNNQNQNIEVRQYNASMELFKKYLNSFDENGIQKEVLTLDNSGNAIEKTISVYQFY